MTTVIAVRHGESEGNAAGVIQGQYPTSLTEKGRLQAACTAEYLDRYHIDAVYASDLPRAMQTAGYTAGRQGLAVIPEKGLREIYAGLWEMRPSAEIDRLYPADHAVWHNDMANSRPTGGESVRETAKRVAETVARLAAENDGKTIAVFTHALAIRCLGTVWRGEDIEALNAAPWIANAAVCVVDYESDGTYDLRSYGECAHLEAKGLITHLSPKV